MIELLIVLAVVAILLAIAIPQLRRARDQAFEVAMQTDLERLTFLQEQHRALGAQSYTADFAELDFVSSEGIDVTVTDVTPFGWAAQARHRAEPDLYCSIFSSPKQATPPWPATQPGEVNCGRRQGGSAGSGSGGIIR